MKVHRGEVTDELEEYMKENWSSIKKQNLNRTYKPQLILKVEIPKANGGVRKLGIPIVIEQEITQVLTTIFDPMFHDSSYGFRPNRCCEQAIVKLLELFNSGYVWVVDQCLKPLMKMYGIPFLKISLCSMTEV